MERMGGGIFTSAFQNEMRFRLPSSDVSFDDIRDDGVRG